MTFTIPTFWCGFCCGAASLFALLLAVALIGNALKGGKQ